MLNQKSISMLFQCHMSAGFESCIIWSLNLVWHLFFVLQTQSLIEVAVHLSVRYSKRWNVINDFKTTTLRLIYFCFKSSFQQKWKSILLWLIFCCFTTHSAQWCHMDPFPDLFKQPTIYFFHILINISERYFYTRSYFFKISILVSVLKGLTDFYLLIVP